ncbi:MAG TPA: hypothetical protein QGF58_20480 [Myxococcota bacterium]|nr:hypothetical protein [Myxococcota bacterium]
MVLLLLACSEVVEDVATGDGFAKDTDIRMVSPAAGASVSQDFIVTFEAGAALRRVQVELDGEPAGAMSDPTGRLDVSAEPGRRLLSLVGYDRQGAELSRDEREVRVLSDEEEASGWVAITTPSDGAHPVNPVTFVADGSGGVATIEFLADDWSLGTTAPGEVLTYSFSGTGFERVIVARGLDADGAELGEDTITITVEDGGEAGPTDFNELLVDMVGSYPMDGTYEFYWPSGGGWSGGTQDLWYQGEQIGSDGGYSACYCSGITWEWYIRSFQEWAAYNGADPEDLNGVDEADIWSMRLDWYVRELYGPGPSVAMETYGLGVEVPSFDDWEPGDIVQFWRTSGSGHTAVFMGWIEDDDGNRVGMEYASCQGSTDGLGINDEYFGSHAGALDPAFMYAARGYLPGLWY